MTDIILRKLYCSLVPIDQDGMDFLEKIKFNSDIVCIIKKKRNLGYHRKFMALVGVAFDAWEPAVNEYKGVQIEKNRDRFRKDLMIMAGFGYPVVTLKGDVRYEAKSMSFANMDHEEFNEMYSRVVDIVLQKVLSNYTKEDLDRVVANVLGFA